MPTLTPLELCSVFSDPSQATEFDPRLRSTEQDALIRSFQALSLDKQGSDIPVRPGWGTVGTPIKLRSNFFAVKVPKGPLYEYDVKITPAATARRLKKRVFELLEECVDFEKYKNFIAHDGSSKVIAARQLPQPLVILDVPYYDEDEDGPDENSKTYSFEFNYVQTLDLSTLVKYVTLLHISP